MQPVNNNSNALAANANNNSAALKSINASNQSNKDGNNTKVQSNGNAYKVSLSKGSRKKAKMLASEQARDTIRNKRNGKKSRSNASDKAGQAQKSDWKQGKTSR